MEERIFRFGKYKGQPIKKIIVTHIGYVMWCLSNISNFELTEEEQSVYDAIAISILKYGINMVFPVDEMASYIKNKKALEDLETPFIATETGYSFNDFDNPIVKSVLKYRDKKPTYNSTGFDLIAALAHCYEKMEDYYFCDYEDF